MALLGQPGDVEFTDWRQILVEPVVAVLYKHPQNIKGLQFMGEASGLRRDTGGLTYRVLIATAGMHVENTKVPEVVLLTKAVALYVPLRVKDFASVLTNGDSGVMFDKLAEIQATVRPRYNILP